MVTHIKKILITGTNGFIGKNLFEFYSNNYEVLTHTRNDNLDHILLQKPDAIINCAADIYDETNMFESNVKLVYTMIEYVKKTKIKMIQIGSSSEYGRKQYPSKETDKLEPTTPYEASKGAASLLSVGYAKYFKLPIVVARPYSVYGKYEKSYRLFSSLYNAYKYKKPMTLYEGYHDFIYVKDFIRGLDILINSNDDKICGDVVNFGSGIQTSNTEILQECKTIFGHIPNCINVDARMVKSFESKTWLCNTTYAKDVYNFSTKFTLRDGIVDLFKEMELIK